METRPDADLTVRSGWRMRSDDPFPALLLDDESTGRLVGAITLDGIDDPLPTTRYSAPQPYRALESLAGQPLSGAGVEVVARIAAVTAGSSDPMRWAAAQTVVLTLLGVIPDPTLRVDADSDPSLLALATELELLAIDVQSAPVINDPVLHLMFPGSLDQPRLLVLGDAPSSIHRPAGPRHGRRSR